MNTKNIRIGVGESHKGFTLVELIVVITILVILGTIGFVSIQGFSTNARDSVRVSDIGSIMKSIELSNIKTGSYPPPDSSFAVTYSGWTVWNQGVFGASAMTRLSGLGINKAPVDPLNNAFYTYSLLAYGNTYQFKADYEWDTVAYNTDSNNLLISQTYAASGNPTLAVVKWNYQWLTAKTLTGGIYYVLAIPSIITSTGTVNIPIDIASNTLSWTLITNGSQKTGITYNPNKVIFSGATIPTSDTASGITNMMIALQNAYTGTVLATSNSTIQKLLTTPTSSLASLWAGVITNQLWGSASASTTTASVTTTTFSLSASSVTAGTSVTITNTCSTPPTSYTSSNTSIATISSTTITTLTAGTTNITPVWGNCTDSTAKVLTVTAGAYSSATTYTAGQQFTYNGATITVTATGRGTSSSQYSGCNTADLAIWTNGATAPYIWSMCNAGATTAYASQALTNCGGWASDCDSGLRASIGSYYQWGKNRDVTSLSASAGPIASDSLANFITNGTSPYDWITTQNDNLWWGGSTTSSAGTWSSSTAPNQALMQWPCPTNYHVPTQLEWCSTISAINGSLTCTSAWQNDTSVVTALKLPLSGYRHLSTAGYYNQGTHGYYWSSSPSTTNGYFVLILSTQVYPLNTNLRANGFSVRCLKN